MESAESLRKKLDDERAARSELKAVVAAHHGVTEQGEPPTGEPADKFQAELSEQVREAREKESLKATKATDDKVQPATEVPTSNKGEAGGLNNLKSDKK
jgi:hypothetical protein